MNSTLDKLFQSWLTIYGSLFPWLKEELGELTEKHHQLVTALEVIRLESHLSRDSTAISARENPEPA